MWPAIQRVAKEKTQDSLIGVHTYEVMAYETLMWDTFVDQPGQEHWHCACGLAEVHPYARF